MPAPINETGGPARNYAVDSLRALGALSVISLHMSYSSANNELIHGLTLCSRWAVPFFFLVSGYFYEKKSTLGYDITFTETLKNLIGAFIVANIIYLPIALKTDFFSLADILSLKSILAGDYIHLWFIGSIIFAYILLWFILSLGLIRIMPFIAIIVLLFSLLADPYSDFTHIRAEGDLSRFILSVPFLFIGLLFAKYRWELKANKLLIILILAIGFMMQFAESKLIFMMRKHDLFSHEFLLGTFIFAIGLFLLAFQTTQRKDNFLSKIGRKYSLMVYLYHPIPIVIIFYIIKKTGLRDTNYSLWFNPLSVFIFTLVVINLISTRYPKLFNILSGKLT